MSQNQKMQSCACCKAYLFEEDDVVYCPVCGAPHHRECYNKLEHCALEALHGTENEYNAEAEAIKTAPETNKHKTCPNCGESYSAELRGCPKCENTPFNAFSIYENFDFLGGVPADMILEDGITAAQAKKFVLSNTHRYIPKFAMLNKKNKVSWNWMAFLFPCGWMLSRKMYKNGIIAGIFSIIASFLTYPLSLQLYQLGFDQNSGYAEMAAQLVEILPDIGLYVMLFALIGGLFNLSIRIVSGMFGDYLYRSYALSTIKEINLTSEDAEFDFRKKGGTNIFLFLIGSMLIQYIPSIIASFL